MKKLLIVPLILIACIVVAGCGGGSKSPAGPETCTLNVTGLRDGSALLKDVSVKVVGGTQTYEGTTDASGNVTISSIPVGKYFIRFAKNGLATTYVQKTLISGTNTDKDRVITPWSALDGAFLAGKYDSSIGNVLGGVYDSDGKTRLSGVSVSVSPAPKKMYYMIDGGSLDDSATATNDSGMFLLVLNNGTYTLTASGASKNFDPVQLTVTEPSLFMGFQLNAK